MLAALKRRIRVEIFQAEGMQYAVLDMEHGAVTLLLIRPEASLYHVLRKYIDMGAAGLLLPWTKRQEQTPRGRRGPGGPSIFHNRTLDRAGWQIESPGIENVASLAAPDWVDATMLGPYDLSLNLNRCGQMDHSELVAAKETIRDRSATAGKPCGMVANSAEQAAFWIPLVCDITEAWRQGVR
jgi:2-keto-3-deoxy-L-rhamnonate aldolase RhmA